MNKSNTNTYKLFQEKFTRLESSTLISFLRDKSVNISFDLAKNKLNSDSVIPEWEMLESYVLNLRFFIQDNESISLNNMSKLYNKSFKETKNKFEDIRTIVKNNLESKCPFSINGENLTYRDFFNGMIYTQLAHAKKEENVFCRRYKTEFFKYLALDTFLRCIKMIHSNLGKINSLNEETFSIKHQKG